MYTIDDKPVTIKKNVDSKNGLDFAFLKEQGIEYIEQLGRKLWTNYNLSDSGIAFLEVLIYGITDLELRISQPIQDILTTETNAIQNHRDQFHSAKNILTSAPVTELDYRKLFIDGIDGVKNVWLEKHQLPIYVECNPKEPKYSFTPLVSTDYKTGSFNVKGLYSLSVEFEEKGVNKMQVFNDVINMYHENRNLCEDLAELKEVCQVEIKVCANIQIDSEANEELIDAQIQFEIENYLSPHVGRYSLSELLEKGIPTEDIFNGPKLENGFIDDEELIASQLGRDVRLSDIINLIMNIDGVKYIEDIQIMSFNQKGEEECRCDSRKENVGDDWIICISKNVKANFGKDSNLQYKKGYLGVQVNWDKRQKYLEELRASAYASEQKSCDDLPAKVGQYNDLASYWSIQNDLPENYWVGESELPTTSSKESKIQAKQLKAYLLLMEQVLATYFAQLGNVTNLFSTQLGGSAAVNSNYAINLIEGISNREELVGPEADYIISLEDKFRGVEDYELRRNGILNHLFARFAENFGAYAEAMSHLNGTYNLAKAINDKNDFLDIYADYSYRRNLAMNYYESPIWNTDTNLPGLQEKIGYTISLDDKRRRCLYPAPVADNMQEGMFAIENILLLPTKRSVSTAAFTDFKIEEVVEVIDAGPPVITEMKYRWEVKFYDYEMLSDKTFDNEKDAYDHFNRASKALCNGLEKVVDAATGKNKLAWIEKNDAVTVEVMALTDMLLSDSEIESIMDSFDSDNTIDAFDFCCFQYDFIDTTASLEFSPCALPCLDTDCNTCSTADFFSYRMTFVLPGWTDRFRDIGFRNFMEHLIYEDLHAHILPRICWVGYERTPEDPDVMNDLDEISRKWKAYLEWKSDNTHQVHPDYFDLADKLLCTINHLNNLHETGHLHGCISEEEILEKCGVEISKDKKKIILNQSTLGTLKTK